MPGYSEPNKIFGKPIKQDDIPSESDVIKYTASGDFQCQPGDTASLALNDLTDVTITAPAAGEYLRKGVGDFVNAAIQVADVPELPTTKITGTAVITTDSRLSDARTPLAHSHPESDVTNLVTDLAAKEATVNKGAINGYAGLNASQQITNNIAAVSQIPNLPTLGTLPSPARQTAIVDSEMTSMAASKLITDLVPDARLGSGTPSISNFLRGDRTWAAAGGGTAKESLVAQWSQSIIKTNIGTAFVDIYNQTNAEGKSISIDTNGKTEVKLSVNWNKIGAGTQTVQVIDVVGSAVLISINVVSGYQETALTTIPAGLANSVKRYKLQAKSTTAADDPVFEGAGIYLK